MNDRLRAGLAPLPLRLERYIRLFTASEAMLSAAMSLSDIAAAVIDEPGSRFDDYMKLSSALRAESGLLLKDAGGIIHGAALPRRHRGDPSDVSPYAPSLSDLRAVWRWLWAWQVREGRIRPRSARERAIAATGERERQMVRDAPEPQPARPRSAAEGRRAR